MDSTVHTHMSVNICLQHCQLYLNRQVIPRIKTGTSVKRLQDDAPLIQGHPKKRLPQGTCGRCATPVNRTSEFTSLSSWSPSFSRSPSVQPSPPISGWSEENVEHGQLRHGGCRNNNTTKRIQTRIQIKKYCIHFIIIFVRNKKCEGEYKRKRNVGLIRTQLIFPARIRAGSVHHWHFPDGHLEATSLKTGLKIENWTHRV